MKPEFSQLSPEERDMRITALVLGELTEPEAAQLHEAMSVDPELRKAYEQRKRTMELLGETVAAHAGVPENAPVRLSEDRRKNLLTRFAAAYVEAKKAVHRKREPRSLWYVPLSIAALLIALLGVAIAYIGGFAPMQRREAQLAYDLGEAGEILEHFEKKQIPRRVTPLPGASGGGDIIRRGESQTPQFRTDLNTDKSYNEELAVATSDKPAQKLIDGRTQGSDDLVKSAETMRGNLAKADVSDRFGIEPGLRAPAAPPPAAVPVPTPMPAPANRPAGGSSGLGRSFSYSATESPAAASDGTTYAGVSINDPAAKTPHPEPAPSSGPQSGGTSIDLYALSDRENAGTQNRFKGRVTENDWDSLARVPIAKQEQEVLRRESQVAVNGRNEFREFFDSDRDAAPADARYDTRKVDEQIAAGKDFAAGRSTVDNTTPLGSKSASIGGVVPQSQSGLNWGDQLSSAQNGQLFGSGRGGGGQGRRSAGNLNVATGDAVTGNERNQQLGGGFGGGGAVTSAGQAPNDWFFRQGIPKPNATASEGKTLESLGYLSTPAEPLSESKKKAGALPEGEVRQLNSADAEKIDRKQINEQEVRLGELPQLGVLFNPQPVLPAINGPVAATQPTEERELKRMAPTEGSKEVAARVETLDGVNTKALKEVERRLSDAPVAARPASAPPVPQPEVLTRENAFSTFSLNVADVSYKLAAASLERGVMPDAAGIRVEEFINAFDYRDPQPAAGMPVAFASERARYPFAHNRDMLRLSVKTAAQGREAGKPLNVVVLLDNSGSMERADRVRIVQECLRTLARQFQPQDKLSVVTFARTARLWVDGVSGTNAAAVAEQVGNLMPQGGTNLEEALDLAYRTAVRHFQAQSISRVVLMTDGAANLGNVDPQALKAKVETYRKQGIALDSFGVGWEGYNDDLLETLTRNGDGRYGFINTPDEAGPRFAGQLAGALRVAASDVKVQVEFNPKRVSSWRQVGYAKHQLTKEQFRDNTVDAAEIGAAEAGNALYVIETKPLGEGPVATVRVRYKTPGTSDYYEQEWQVAHTPFVPPAENASSSMRLAASSAAFAEWLAGSPFAGEVTTDRLLKMINGVPESFGADARPKQLEWMIRQAKSISGK